jgi:hypothetical protein
VHTYGGRDAVVGGGDGDEADEEAALADGRVPDEQDLERAVVAARRRRGHAFGLSDQQRGGEWWVGAGGGRRKGTE